MNFEVKFSDLQGFRSEIEAEIRHILVEKINRELNSACLLSCFKAVNIYISTHRIKQKSVLRSFFNRNIYGELSILQQAGCDIYDRIYCEFQEHSDLGNSNKHNEEITRISQHDAAWMSR